MPTRITSNLEWDKGLLGFSAVLKSWRTVLVVTNVPGLYHTQCEPAWLGCESSVPSCSLGCLPWQQQWPLCVFMKPPCGFSVIQIPYAMLLASAQLSRKGEKWWKETAVLTPTANNCSSSAQVITYSCF